MLRGWFESTFGDYALAAQFVVAVIAVVLLLAIIAWLFGKRSKRNAVRGPARGRQPRLSVMEAATVDSKRRLVLVRRDHVEHLVMIGGPSDIVVEPNIIRGRPASSALARTKQLAAQRAQAQNAQIQAAQVQGAQVQGTQGQHPAQLHSAQLPANGASDRQLPAAASPSAAAMAAAVLSRPDEAGSPVGQTAAARLVPTEQSSAETQPDTKEPPQVTEPKKQEAVTAESDVPVEAAPTDQVYDKADRKAEHLDPAGQDADLPEPSLPERPLHETPEHEAQPSDSPDSEAQRAGVVPGAQQRSEEQPVLPDEDPAGTDPVHSDALDADQADPDQVDPDPANEELADSDDVSSTITVASLAAGAAALAAAAGSRSPTEDADTVDTDPLVAEVDLSDQATNGEFTEDETERASTPELSEPIPAASEQERLETVLDPVHDVAAVDAAPVEAQETLDEQAESQDAVSDTGTLSDVPPVESAGEDTDNIDQLDFPTADAGAEAEATSPVVATSQPEINRGADPYADLENDFRQAFETSLRGLKDKIHGESTQASEDHTSVEPSETAGSPEATEAPDPAESEIESLTSKFDQLTTDTETEEEATPSEASQDDAYSINPAHSAEVELLQSVSPGELAPDMSDQSDTESSAAPETEDAGPPESALPPELAFLDSPAPDTHAGESPPEEEQASDSDGVETEAADTASEQAEAQQTATDDEPAPVVRNAEPDYPPEPTPGQNPFPTIPESVRKSVMAAASRAIPPELAAGLADGMDKDVATTTLGDLAQRLEKALSEQSVAQATDEPPEDTDASDPLPGLASGHADDDQTSVAEAPGKSDDGPEDEEREEGAVIDFNALRREEAEETLEDEMAKLLNDLASDANKAS